MLFGTSYLRLKFAPIGEFRPPSLGLDISGIIFIWIVSFGGKLPHSVILEPTKFGQVWSNRFQIINDLVNNRYVASGCIATRL